MTPRRKILNDFAAATRDIELTEAAINLLERVRDSRAVRSSINSLKREQQTHLRRLDAAAEKLGAPYGARACHAPRFPKTYCSQCGGEFGPGDEGYSHCADHAGTTKENDRG